jgi:transcriptional regulator with XRE-family HTH domain
MATKKELAIKRELARLYYMQGETQREIAEKTGVSEQTVGKWVNDGNWAIKRAAVNITRAELVNKTLIAINAILEQFNTSEDPSKTIDADKLSKLAKIVGNLDKKSNIVNVIETFMSFTKWLQYRMIFDNEITIELVKTINKYQDLFISEQATTNH